MIKVTYKIPNISCSHCVATIKYELLSNKCIKSVDVNVGTKHVEITYDEPADEEMIKKILKEISYP